MSPAMIALLIFGVLALSFSATFALLQWAQRQVGPLTKEVGSLHDWSRWEIAEEGHELLDAVGKPVATQERRCSRCGYRQVDEIGDMAESNDDAMDGHCSLIYGTEQQGRTA